MSLRQGLARSLHRFATWLSGKGERVAHEPEPPTPNGCIHLNLIRFGPTVYCRDCGKAVEQ